MSSAAALELCLVTADTRLAAAAESTGVERVLVDLETLGKAERQAGEGLYLSTHTLDDVHRIRRVLRTTELMVRTNPVHAESGEEVRAVLEAEPDVVMLAMARSAEDVRVFVELVDGRAEVSVLVENVAALEALPQIVGVPGVAEIHVGLNDLRLSLGFATLFDPLCSGHVDRAALVVHEARLRFGFGGVTSPRAQMPVHAERIIGEQVRLGSRLAWLGRSFRELLEHGPLVSTMEENVCAIRACLEMWALASDDELDANRARLVEDVMRWHGSRAPAGPSGDLASASR